MKPKASIFFIILSSVGFLISIIMYGIHLYHKEDNSSYIISPLHNHREKYNHTLFLKTRSIQALSDTLNSLAKEKDILLGSLEYVVLANKLVEERFLYQYSRYDYHENPYLAIMGACIWNHLNAVVSPNDLMKYNHAACSQQSIILMELLKVNGIHTRKVGLHCHFCMEASINNEWYFFDPTKEPEFHDNSLRKNIQGLNLDIIRLFYAKSPNIEENFTEYHIGKTDSFPAKNVKILHQICFLLLHHGILFFGISTFLLLIYQKSYDRQLSISLF